MIVLHPIDESTTESFIYSTGAESFSNAITSGDFNKDGWTNVVVATTSKLDNVNVFLGFNYPIFIVHDTIEFLNEAAPHYFNIADFNGDHQSDLMITAFYSATIHILLGAGNGTFINFTEYSTGIKLDPYAVALDDFDMGNRTDMVILNNRTRNGGIFFGFGNGTFFSSATYALTYSSKI